MTKVIKLTDKIPRVDINHYLASSSEDSRVCVLSERDVTIIRSYMFPGVEWPTRFVRPLGGDNYETGTEGEFSEYQEAINELDYKLSGGLTMSLETALDSIADAITALANAQNNTELNNVVRAIATSSVCCEQQIINQGGGVIGSVEQPVGGNNVPIFGIQEPVSVTPGTYPDGYTSLEEYQLDKCQISNLIVDGIIGTLRNLGAFGVFNGVALAGLIVTAVVGIIIFPPAFIPVAAACIGFLSVEVTLLTLAANYIQDNREDWVCAIYNSDGTEEAVAVLADLIDALIAAIGAEAGAGFWVKQILLLLCNADTLNQAMQKTAHQTYPDADCSGCEEPLVWFGEDSGHDYGRNLVKTGDLTWTFQGYQYQDGWQASVFINQGLNGVTYYTRLTTNPSPTSWYQAGTSQLNISTPNTYNYQGDGPMTVNLTGNNIVVRDNDDDYTATLELSVTPFE